MLDRLRGWAKALKQELQALCLAVRDARVPWYAKALGVFVIGYALSPIDLIPDFIPVLGLLDDALLLPLGIQLTLCLIPKHVIAECRERVRQEPMPSRASWIAGVIIVSIWLALLLWGVGMGLGF